MKYTLEIFVLSVIVLFGNTALAGEPERIPLSLSESIVSTLKNNYEIVIDRIDPKIVEKNIGISESDFDATMFAEVGWSNGKSPNYYDSLNTNEDTSFGEKFVSLGVRQTIKTGASYELSLGLSEADSDTTLNKIDPVYKPSATLSVTQPLLRGAGTDINVTGIMISRNNAMISDHQFSQAVQETITKTNLVYWNLISLNMRRKVLVESLARTVEFLRKIELQVKVGALAKSEIASAKSLVAIREIDLIDIDRKIGDTQDALKSLINRPGAQPGGPATIEATEKPVYRKIDLDIDRLTETAVKKRPVYQQTLLSIDSKRREVEFLEDRRLMTLNLNAGANLYGTRGPENHDYIGNVPVGQFEGTMSDSISDGMAGKYFDFSISLLAEYPIFNRNAKNRAVKSVLQLESLETRLEAIRQNIELDVSTAVRGVRTAELMITASRVSRELSERKLQSELRKFEIGSSTIFTILRYQNDLAIEEANEVTSLTDYLTGIAQLNLATGMVLEKNNISIEE